MPKEPSQKDKKMAERLAQIVSASIEPGVAFVLITAKIRSDDSGADTFVICNVPTDESSRLLQLALERQHSGVPWIKELDHE